MKIGITRIMSIAAFAVPALWASHALAQDATVTQSTTTTPATTVATPPQTNVYVQPSTPASTTTTTSAPVAVAGAGPVAETRESGYAPNTFLLTSGLLVFGIPYLSSVVVAASSGNSEDHHLYVPLAGPWIDMANRGGCATGSTNCDSETTNKVMLGVDGVFQAIGALEIVSAFLSPEHREVTTVPATAYTPSITVQPVKLGYAAYGLGAFARF